MQVNTNENTLIAKIVGLVIALVVVGMVLVPFVNDATTTKRTFENEGYFFMDKISATDEGTHTISWAVSTPNIIVVDGTNIDVASFGLPSGYSAVTIFATETDIIRIGASNDGTSLSWVQVRGSTWYYSASTTSFTATIAGGDLTAVLDGTTRATTYTDAYLISDDEKGAFVMKKANEKAYMKEDSEYYNIGVTSVTGGYFIFKVEGDLESATVTPLAKNPETYSTPTISDEEIVKNTVSGYKDLYQFDKLTFTATYNDGTNDQTLDCVYNYVIVPASVTAELSQHASSIEITLYQMIPILVVLGLIVGIVGLLAYNHRNNN